MTLTFKSNNGTVWPLDGSLGVTVAEGASGIYAVPWSLVIDQRVEADGGVLVSRRQQPRPVDLPLLLVDPGDTEVLTLWGQLLYAFAAGGVLEHNGPHGVRQLRQVTLETPSQNGTLQDLTRRVDDTITVSLVALDPWWYGTADPVSVSLDQAPTAFDAPIPFDSPLPFDGGTSISVEVAGNAPAYPVFAVEGAFDSLTVMVGAMSWVWQRPMAAGEVGQYDTRPGSRGPRMGSTIIPGHPLQRLDFTLVGEGSRYPMLPQGTTPVVFSAANPDSAAALTIYWETRWLTP